MATAASSSGPRAANRRPASAPHHQNNTAPTAIPTGTPSHDTAGTPALDPTNTTTAGGNATTANNSAIPNCCSIRNSPGLFPAANGLACDEGIG